MITNTLRRRLIPLMQHRCVSSGNNTTLGQSGHVFSPAVRTTADNLQSCVMELRDGVRNSQVINKPVEPNTQFLGHEGQGFDGVTVC